MAIYKLKSKTIMFLKILNILKKKKKGFGHLCPRKHCSQSCQVYKSEHL